MNLKSFVAALFVCAELGLEPSYQFGEVYFKRSFDRKEATAGIVSLHIGYKGMIKLAHESGIIESINAFCVWDGDDYNFEAGDAPRFTHKMRRPKSKTIEALHCAYAIAKLTNGGSNRVVVWHEDIKKIHTQRGGSSFSPWQNHLEAMAQKTAVRRLFRLLPMSRKMALAVHLEDANEINQGQNNIVSLVEAESAHEDSTSQRGEEENKKTRRGQ